HLHRASGDRDRAMGRTAYLAWVSDNAAGAVRAVVFSTGRPGIPVRVETRGGEDAGCLRRAGSVAPVSVALRPSRPSLKAEDQRRWGQLSVSRDPVRWIDESNVGPVLDGDRPAVGRPGC